MKEYQDYNNEEIFYDKKRDEREHNVVEHIKTLTERKSEIVVVNDDHVSETDLKKYIRELEDEVYLLKNDKLVTALKSLVAAGGDVVLEGNVDIETALVVDKDITLDLSGHHITVKEDTVGDGVFHVTNGTMIINGDGCINGVGKNDYNMAIWADGGNVIINGGKFTNEGATAESDPTHMDLIYSKNGSTIEINGGFFKCATPKWTLNKHDKTESTILVKGGTFVNYDPSHSETENPVANFVAEGYKVVSEVKDTGEVHYTVVAE